MDDSIVDVDEALSDSFYRPSDESFDAIQAIVSQWKAVETANDSQNEDKYFDTRTFTRPKKRFSNNFVPNINSFGAATASATVTEKQQQPVNLQIGGLVTSMQRSFLGDVSPPTSFCSNDTSMMGSSLITSSDFANVSYFMNASNGGGGGGDATAHHILSNQTTNHYQPAQLNNYTFDRLNQDNLLNTSPPASIRSDLSYAVQTDICNSTFDAVITDKTLVVHNNATSDPIREEDEEQCSLVTKESRANLGETIVYPDTVTDVEAQSTMVSRHQSTPVRTNAKIDIGSPFVSPISSHTFNPRRRSTYVAATLASQINNNNNNKNEDESYTPPPIALEQQTAMPVSSAEILIRESTFVQNISDLADKERQSLTNFEEYEKSLSTLKNDEEFENMLNSLGHNQSQVKNDKMRQSLDHIKKRHSLLNIEKQQESLLRRSACDSNKLMESMDKSMGSTSSTSSSGSRLLRRSRLFDDIGPMQSTEAIVDTKNHMNETIAAAAAAATNATFGSSKESTTPNGPHAIGETNSNPDEPSAVDTGNRDRFKTIRLSRKPPDSSVPSMREVFPAGIEHSSAMANEPFAKIDFNSPQANHRNGVTAKDQHAAPTITNRRQLARPRQLSGLAKRDFSAKSSSADSLTNRTVTSSAAKPAERNAMGSKSKSIHSLVGNGPGQQQHRMAICDIAVQPDIEGLFKVPMPLGNQRYNVMRKTGLIRPSSGYYSHTVKRNDSDTESGRLSPSSSLSSGSSKSSLHKIGVSSSQQQSDTNREDSPPVAVMSAPVSRASSVQPIAKRSGLQAPTNYRKSGLPRPMSMASNR